MFRNKSPEFECKECGKKAEFTCDFCESYCEEIYCKKCMKLHPCYEEEGKECMVRVPNSPRMGECGYRGYEEDDVIQYFPKDVFES